MRAYVFTDKALAKQAGRFVWLEIDTEKKQNAAFKTHFPVPALPTFFVVDPATEQVALRWVGGATVPQLEKLLDDGARAVGGGAAAPVPIKKGPAALDGALARADNALVRADALYGAGRDAEAAAAYREALDAAPEDWPRYGRAVESLLFALYQIEDHKSAAGLARDAFPKLSRTPSAANVAGSGLGSALELPETDPERAALVTALESDARAVLGDPALPLAADDRSGLYGVLLDAREAAKDSAGAHAVAKQWATFLETAAARAPNADARTVFDSHRLSAYLALGEPERAIPMLEASERDLPDDYNPPARLAITYKALGRWDEALEASDRALGKAYGPRRLRILMDRSDIYKGRGNLDLARRTLEEALLEAEALPEGQRSDTTIRGLRKRLDALPKS